MDCDDERRSSSSLSSTEWEDQDSGADEDDDEVNPFKRDDGEADDEQSDWHETPGKLARFFRLKTFNHLCYISSFFLTLNFAVLVQYMITILH